VNFIGFILRVITNNYVQISKIRPCRISTTFGMQLDPPRTGVSLEGRQKWMTHSLTATLLVSAVVAGRLRTACVADFGLTPGTSRDCLCLKRQN
jgi:hypothetical protein